MPFSPPCDRRPGWLLAVQQTRGPGQAHRPRGTRPASTARLAPDPRGPLAKAASTAHPSVATEEESVLKYFVSTHRTQGERDNDPNNIPATAILDHCSL